MSKIDVNKVAEVLKKNEVDPALLRRVIEELNLAAQSAEGDADTPPARKKQFVILLADPEGRLPKTDFAGWVLQLPEDESITTTLERIFKAAYDYNRSKKGKLFPAKTVGEVLENVPAKHFKEVELWVKTKSPVLMLRTDNEIPRN